MKTSDGKQYQIIEDENEPSLPKTKKYINSKGKIIKLQEEEPSEETPSEEIEEKPKTKKEKKPLTMTTKDGKKVKIVEEEKGPITYDKRGNRKPRKKKIVNENGEVEEVKEIIEDEESPSEIDEETGKKKPKIRKYYLNLKSLQKKKQK